MEEKTYTIRLSIVDEKTSKETYSFTAPKLSEDKMSQLLRKLMNLIKNL